MAGEGGFSGITKDGAPFSGVSTGAGPTTSTWTMEDAFKAGFAAGAAQEQIKSGDKPIQSEGLGFLGDAVIAGALAGPGGFAGAAGKSLAGAAVGNIKTADLNPGVAAAEELDAGTPIGEVDATVPDATVQGSGGGGPSGPAPDEPADGKEVVTPEPADDAPTPDVDGGTGDGDDGGDKEDDGDKDGGSGGGGGELPADDSSGGGGGGKHGPRPNESQADIFAADKFNAAKFDKFDMANFDKVEAGNFKQVPGNVFAGHGAIALDKIQSQAATSHINVNPFKDATGETEFQE